MASDDGQPGAAPEQQAPAATTAELIDHLSRFQGPPQLFLVNLLAVQCHLASADGGAILRLSAEGRVEILAVYPPQPDGATVPSWLAQAAEAGSRVSAGGEMAILPVHAAEDLYDQPPRRHLALVPLSGQRAHLRGLAAFVIASPQRSIVEASRDKLELTTSLLSLYEMRLTLQQRQADLRRLRMALEVIAVLNEHERFAGLAMALCNELVIRWQCERVGLGFLKGRYVRLKALSHTEKFSRKMRIVQDLEAAMEECLDQDIEIIHPAPQEATYVSRCAAELSKQQGPTNVLSLPLRRAGEPVAVLVLERPADMPFSQEDAEALRLTCDLCSARLADLYHQDRWFGARAAASMRKGLSVALGPKHTWLKVAALLVAGLIVFLALGKGDFQAQGKFSLQASERQVLPAPFDGYLDEINAAPGDAVVANKTVLATLETSEMRIQLVGLLARRREHELGAATARSTGKTAEAQIAEAKAEQVSAQIRLLERRINEQARIVSPISGVVISEDLRRKVGGGKPVQTGDVLFEVASLDSLRAEILIPEDQIAEVQLAQEGELALSAFPDHKVRFVVERINPVAELVDQESIFRVHSRLDGTAPWMRPGMEGIAKIKIDHRPYGVLWTRRLVNWVRMKLWW